MLIDYICVRMCRMFISSRAWPTVAKILDNIYIKWRSDRLVTNMPRMPHHGFVCLFSLGSPPHLSPYASLSPHALMYVFYQYTISMLTFRLPSLLMLRSTYSLIYQSIHLFLLVLLFSTFFFFSVILSIHPSSSLSLFLFLNKKTKKKKNRERTGGGRRLSGIHTIVV